MRLKLFTLVISLSSIFFSCKDAKEFNLSEPSELKTDDSHKEVENEISVVETVSIIQRLQGNWKESEYPFRVAQFQGSLVKFIEEGFVEEPRFQEYKISGNCPFEVNNINNIGPEDLILVLIENNRCEKLKVTNDTLTLSGLNASMGAEYHIVYNRVD